MNKNILLVEDEFIIAMGKKKELEKYGYTIQHVNTGEKAVSLVNENTDIDLILMDIDLGKGIDGTETAALILKEHDIPIVFLSSHTESDVVEKTEKITSYGYVVKNSSITVLDASIKMAFKLFDANSKTEKHRQHLRTTLNSIGDAVITTDILGNVTDINPVAENLTGWNFELAFGKQLSEIFNIINEETHKKICNPIKNVLETGKIMGLANHTILISKDGSEHQIADSAAPIKDSDGLITGVVLVFRDVTEQKIKENTIKAYQQRLALHINQTPLAVIDWDVDFNVISWNKSAEKMFGFTSEEIIGKKAARLIVPDDIKDIIDDVWATIINQTGGTHNINDNVTKDGRTISCEWYNTVVVNDTGTVVGVSSLVMDVTEKKQAQLFLSKNKEFINSILKSIHDPIFVIDINKKFTAYHNSSDSELYIPPENFIGKSILDVLPEDVARNTNNAINEILKTGKLQKFDYSLQIGDNLKYYESNVSPMFDGDKNIISFISINRDITERKLSEEIEIKTTANLNSIINNRKEAIWSIDTNYNYIIFNDFFKDAYKNAFNIDLKNGMNALEILSSELLEMWKPKYDEALSGETVVFEFVSPDNCFYEVFLNPIITSKEITGVTALSIDITEHKQIEKELKTNLYYLSKAQEMGKIGTWELDFQNNITNWTDETYKIFGIPLGTETTHNLFVSCIHPDDKTFFEEKWKKDLNDETLEIEYRIIVNDKVKWIRDKVEFEFDKKGNPIRVIGAKQDITEQKQAEKEIKKQLLEKETILKESHHRIKNNFTSIGSFISLQINKSTDPKIISALHDVAGRINSMTILYEKLLLTNDFSKTSTKQYLTSLIDELANLLINKNIKVKSNIDDFELDCKRLVPIGIITNELFTNSIKYAFTGKSSGHINIILKKENQNITLIVADDGVGMPENFDINNQNGFGLILTNLYSQQLNGEFKIKHGKGTKCIFKFNLD